MSEWPADPNGDLVPILEMSVEVEAAKRRHPSGVTVPDPAGDILTAVDRCDSCGGSAALYRMRHSKGNRVLDLCGHDWSKHAPKMVDQGWKVTGTNPDLLAQMYGAGKDGHA